MGDGDYVTSCRRPFHTWAGQQEKRGHQLSSTRNNQCGSSCRAQPLLSLDVSHSLKIISKLLWHKCVLTSVHVIRSGTRSQCMSCKSGVMGSYLRDPMTRRAAAFRTDCSLANIRAVTLRPINCKLGVELRSSWIQFVWQASASTDLNQGEYRDPDRFDELKPVADWVGAPPLSNGGG